MAWSYMIKITNEDKAYVLEQIPSTASFFEAQDIEGLLDELFVKHVQVGFDSSDEPTEVGRKLERIMDRLFYENTENRKVN